VEMPHEMHMRLVVGLSARAISIMMKSGDVISCSRTWDSAVETWLLNHSATDEIDIMYSGKVNNKKNPGFDSRR